MSFLADIFSYISGNTTLTNALPFSQWWTGLVPETVSFPYAAITAIGMSPSFTTGTGYYQTFSFQISIFDTDPDNAESLASTIAGQFDYQAISSATISCERTGGPILMVDPDTAKRVYHVLLTYDLLQNRTMPAT